MSSEMQLRCPACSASDVADAHQTHQDPLTKSEYTRHHCRACDVEFWTPLVMPPASYYEEAGGDYSIFHNTGSDVIRWWHRSFMNNFAGLHQKGKILDVGCADGRFLKKMKELGWDIHGLDLDKKSVEVAKQTCGTENIHHCFLDEFVTSATAQTFDVITFFEVLEHQPDPRQFMSFVKRLLKPGGYVAGSVPNTDRYIVDIRYSPDDPPHHFTMWKKPNLERFMRQEGFDDFHSAHVRFEPILLDQIIRKLTRDRIQSLKMRLGVRSFESYGEGATANPSARRLAALKRYVWNPVFRAITLVEFPILWLSRKSVSIYFDAALSGVRK